ncbi:MCE family protein [Amycolatopsis sp. K13G38]|uniref:MCE family protein n=1 Tax=Amycolatopsis acididurans TaxID=2724524 RepID=A0ABX1IW29_9PSEU|nr:MCE family protein [Amycolatopsis acididurans]NKQ51672.1 MCE family protein [Amycolatopsis acididurans]
MAGPADQVRRDTRLGVLGTVLAVLVVAVCVRADAISSALAGRTLHAVFAEAGGLAGGDPVVVSGMAVGKVSDVQLRDTDVRITFTLTEDGVHLGTLTRAGIKSRNMLGQKVLDLAPAGPGEMADEAEIALERTTAPYDITQALQGITDEVSQVDTGQLAAAMNTVADAFAGTPQSVPGAIDGLRRLATSVNSRDAELRDLLRHADDATALLARHDGDLRTLFDQGTSLLTALNERQAVIQQLLTNAQAMADQLTGLAKDNDAVLGPALGELRAVLTVLQRNRDNITAALANAVPLLRELGEVVASEPTLDAYLANVPPTNFVPTLPQLLGAGR